MYIIEQELIYLIVGEKILKNINYLQIYYLGCVGVGVCRGVIVQL